jgi:hypothetical protein
MKIINVTPHDIRLIGPDGAIKEVARTLAVARVTQTLEQVGSSDGIPIYRATYGPVEGLPDPEPDTLFIVSALVRAACPDRSDLASPGELVRGPDGQPIGCRGLIIN